MSDDCEIVYDLFGAVPKPKMLEVHEHSIISGPRAHHTQKIVHSHEDGEIPHQHPDTGPATYTIDKRDWFEASGGVDGGGEKEFTTAPQGEQLPRVELEDWQKGFEIHFAEDPTGGLKDVTGGGHLAAARMVLAFRMTAVVIPFPGPKKKATG